MLVKLEIIFAICCLTGVYMQIRPSCRQIDFNEMNSTLEFEPCEALEMFVIKSYADVQIDSFRSDVENHLTNREVGISCFRTTQIFNLDSNTQFDSMIYLNSNNEADDSFVDIQAFDVDDGEVHFAGGVTVSNEWNALYVGFGLTINAKVNCLL